MSLGLFYFVYRNKKTYALRIQEMLHKIIKKMESHPKIDMKKRNTEVTKQTKENKKIQVFNVKTQGRKKKKSEKTTSFLMVHPGSQESIGTNYLEGKKPHKFAWQLS